jgi:hypothetical protein
MQPNTLANFRESCARGPVLAANPKILEFGGSGISNYLAHSKPSCLTCKEPPVPKNKKPRECCKKQTGLNDELAGMFASLRSEDV